MQLDRYLGLYLSETQEHLRELNRALIDLEEAGDGAALDAAFRAAHTIKGMAATMGFLDVAEHAHLLEDLLEEVRAGTLAIDADVLDRMLAGVDDLEQAVEAAADTPVGEVFGGSAGGAAAGGAAAGAGDDAGADASASAPAVTATESMPPGTELVVRVIIEDACMLKAVRAVMVRTNAEKAAKVLGTAPETFEEDFDGDLRLYVGSDVDRAALESAIRAAGEVETVQFHPVGGQPRPAAGPSGAAETDERRAMRFVRIEQQHLVDLADGIGDLGIVFGQLERLAASADVPGMDELIDRMSRRIDNLQHTVLAARMVPVAEVFDRFRRLVRDAARSLGKEVEYSLVGGEIEMDRELLTALADPILHLLRNSLDHGIEAPAERLAAGKPVRGRLTLRVTRERSTATIEVIDDGRGIDHSRVIGRARAMGLLAEDAGETLSGEELMRLLSQPGLSTAERVSDLSGRGVGLDAVVNGVRALGGAISLESEPGSGTRLTLRLPVTLALTYALRVEVGGDPYAIPLTHIAEAVDLDQEQVEAEGEEEVLVLRGERIPLVRLRQVLEVAEEGTETMAVVTEVGDRRAALAVDRLVTRDQIIVKGFDAAVGTLPVFSGATLLSDGRPALVLDPMSVY